jgi:hypothetical protein
MGQGKQNQSHAGGERKSKKSLFSKTSKADFTPFDANAMIAEEAGVSRGTLGRYNKVMEEGNAELRELMRTN